MALRSVVMGQQAVISQLQAADRLQTQMAEFQKQHGPAKGLAQPDAPGEAATQHRSFVQVMINEGIVAALAARDATRNGDDSHTSGTGVRRPVLVARECTYPDFLKCQPLNFKGTEGVVGLTHWFEKMESVYSISNCTVACQ
ncbi:hypothetical protein Tco_0114594, partial [Tanacetum coccineum]